MPEPTSEQVCQLIKDGRISDAVHLTQHLRPEYIYHELILLEANERPLENYLDFMLAAADDRIESLDEINFIDLATSLLVTALAPLEDSFSRAFELHIKSINLTKLSLERNVRAIEFFKNTPDRELSEELEGRLLSFANSLADWSVRPAPDQSPH